MFHKVKKILCGKSFASMLCAFALFFSGIAANCSCTFIFHEPEKADLSKLRKF